MLKSKKTILGILLCAVMTVSLSLGMFGLTAKTETAYASGTEEHNHTSWTSVTELPTEAGDYNIYLTDNITLSATWEVPEGTTNLCLNGYVINANGGAFSVIKVGENSTLNLYDCDTTTKYYFSKDATTGLWTLAEDQTTPTDYYVTGGIITDGNATENGGGVNVKSGTFNMYGGNIVGNTAQNGGGVSNSNSFTMVGGNIVGNTATENGGGVYASCVIFVNILTGGTITDNTAQNGGGVYYKVEECFAPGTLITMADGTRQSIETLKIGDPVRVFDHEKGEISFSEIFDVWTYPEKHSDVVKLHFSNDIDVSVVYGHSFFEREQNKYVAVTKDNVSNFIGHEFYNVDNERWETLEGYEFIDGEVDTYVITTKYNLNCVANGMLSNEDGFYTLLTNIFEYGDNLKIDQDKKTQDIANFGLYGYDNIKHMSKYVYDVLNFQYLKVAFGKDLITENEFNYLEAYYAEVDPKLYCDEKEETPIESKSGLLKAPLKAPLLTSSVSAPTSGFYVGGSIKILGNNSGNLYISSGKTITIGTGTVGDGNGVVAPIEDMNIGITMADGTGKFTVDGTANYSSNFFSDNDSYKVCFNNNGTDNVTTDDYLELKITIADILKKAENEFPSFSGSLPNNVWVNETCSTSKLYINNNGLTFGGLSLYNILTAPVSKDGNNFVYNHSSGVKITFVMAFDKLVKITLAESEYANYNGDYLPVIDKTLYWGYHETSKTFYLSKTADAITEKDATATEFDAFTPAKEPYGYFQLNNVEKVEILNDIAPVSTAYWFYYMVNATEIAGLEHLNTSNVTDMSYMFAACSSLTELDLSSFNTKNVINMSNMFNGCSKLTSLDISKFNTANVTDMSSMFSGCSSLTSLTFGDNFSTANVTNMSSMFYNCEELASLDISKFNTANVTDMSYMFYGCGKLTSLDISKFNTANVTDMSSMFSQCFSLTELNLSNFDTTKVENMSKMFYMSKNGVTSLLASLDISKFNTANVTDMSYIFYGCGKLTSLDISNFNTAKVENMSSMFYKCSTLKSLDVSKFNTEKVTNMSSLFGECSSLTALDISNFNTAKVENMSSMFYKCSTLKSLDVSKFNTEKVTNMSSLFGGCSSLTALDVSNFNTAKVENISTMFYQCSSLTSLDLSKFDTANVTNMAGLFGGCSSLTSLDLSNFDMTKVTNITKMLDGTTALTQIKTPKNLTKDVTLPTLANSAVWCDATAFAKYENLPKESSTSITLVAGYPITVSDSITNGEVTIQSYAVANSTITFTVAPSDNYQLASDSLKVTYNNGESDQTITPEATQTAGEYTFTMPTFAVKVSAEFEHVHGGWIITGSGSTLTATCGNDGCTDTPYSVVLTLTAPQSLVYDGNPKTFTFADGEADAWTDAGLELPTIIYNIKQSGQSSYLPLMGTLKFVGDYMAQVTVDGKTASALFSISQAEVDKPELDTTNFVYTGSPLTYTVANSDLYSVSGNVETEADTYTVTVELKDKENCKWKNGDSEDLTYSFVIGKATGEIIVDTTTITKTYGERITLPEATSNFGTVTCDTLATDLVDFGTYTVTYTLAGTGNYTGDTKKLTVVINKIAVTKPTADTTNFVYTAQPQTYTLATSNYYTVSDNTTQTNADSYTVTVELKDKTNYEWKDGTTENLTFDFAIDKAQNEITALSLESWTNGETPNSPSATAKFGEVEFMYSKKTEQPNFAPEQPTEVGNYILKAYVVGNDNFDGAIKELEFSINQRVEDVVVQDETGEVLTDSKVEIVSSENGIEPNVVFVIAVINLEKVEDIKTSKQALENENKIAQNEKIYGIYDAKLLINGVSVQPNGTITIKMLVPKELRDKEFRFYHIHNGNEVMEIDNYTDVGDGYITFDVDKLSQFAFVGKYEKHGMSIYSIIAISLGGVILLLLIIYILGYFFLYRKGKLDDKKIKAIYCFLPKENKKI